MQFTAHAPAHSEWAVAAFGIIGFVLCVAALWVAQFLMRILIIAVFGTGIAVVVGVLAIPVSIIGGAFYLFFKYTGPLWGIIYYLVIKTLVYIFFACSWALLIVSLYSLVFWTNGYATVFNFIAARF